MDGLDSELIGVQQGQIYPGKNFANRSVSKHQSQAPLVDDDTLAFGEEDNAKGQKLTHPYVTLFHLTFRGAAILLYIFCGWFVDSFITSFVLIVLLLSMDFWTVKNITATRRHYVVYARMMGILGRTQHLPIAVFCVGIVIAIVIYYLRRLMVGLRWWNYVDDDGVSHWIFESRKGHSQNRINPAEARIFWVALIAAPAVWLLLFLMAFISFKFKWLLLVCIALTLNGANLYGYMKCRMGNSEQSMTSTMGDFFRRQVFQNMASVITKTSTAPPSSTASRPTNVV